MKKYNLPKASLPLVPNPLCDDKRRDEILAELKESGAGTIVLLGDEPVKWLQSVSGCQEKRLADFGDKADTYGKPHGINIGGKEYKVLPLVHPRQASKLGIHSPKWNELAIERCYTWIEGENMTNDLDEKRIGYMELLKALVLEALERRDIVTGQPNQIRCLH